MSARTRLTALALVGCLLAPLGCGSVVSWAEGTSPGVEPHDPRPDLIYSGLRTDVQFLGHSPLLILRIGAFFDLPLSLVFDTVALPVTGILYAFAEPEWGRVDDFDLRELAESHEDPEVRAGAAAEQERRANFEDPQPDPDEPH